MKDEKIIARIPRSASKELVVRTAIYWNINIVDIRWYENGKPTRKGVRVNQDEAKTLITALKKVNVNGSEQTLDKENYEE